MSLQYLCSFNPKKQIENTKENQIMWKTPLVIVVDLGNASLLALSNLSVACDHIKCCD